jgi:hypothetical protein
MRAGLQRWPRTSWSPSTAGLWNDQRGRRAQPPTKQRRGRGWQWWGGHQGRGGRRCGGDEERSDAQGAHPSTVRTEWMIVLIDDDQTTYRIVVAAVISNQVEFLLTNSLGY